MQRRDRETFPTSVLQPHVSTVRLWAIQKRCYSIAMLFCFDGPTESTERRAFTAEKSRKMYGDVIEQKWTSTNGNAASRRKRETGDEAYCPILIKPRDRGTRTVTKRAPSSFLFVAAFDCAVVWLLLAIVEK